MQRIFEKKIILWMKMIHYPNTLRPHLVTIVPMVPFNVVKYTCRLRRYKYTHDQLNTRHFNIIF